MNIRDMPVTGAESVSNIPTTFDESNVLTTPRLSLRKASLKALRRVLKTSEDPLKTFVAMYNYLLSRGQLEEAEEVVFQTLVKASLQGGFSNDWRELSVDSADWSDPNGPGRCYLYSLKTLACIRARQGMQRDAEKIRLVLSKLQPFDQAATNEACKILDGLDEN